MFPDPRCDPGTNGGLRAWAAMTGDRATVRLAGEMDLDAAPRVRAAVRACLRRRPAQLRIDVRRVGFCDCAGLNTLLWARAQACGAHAAFALRGPLQPGMARLLAVTGTGDFLPVSPTSA